jgi:hypothetical protein
MRPDLLDVRVLSFGGITDRFSSPVGKYGYHSRFEAQGAVVIERVDHGEPERLQSLVGIVYRGTRENEP